MRALINIRKQVWAAILCLMVIPGDLVIAAQPGLPSEIQKLSQDFLNLMVAKDFVAASKLLSTEVKPVEFQSSAQQFGSMLGDSHPTLELLDWNSFGIHPAISVGPKPVQAFTDYSIRYQLPLEKAWLLVEVVVRHTMEQNVIYGIRWQESTQSVAELSRFSLSGKTLFQYVFLIAAIFVPLFVLFTFVLCLFTPMPRKWLWAIFCLFGIGMIALNWNDGSVHLFLLRFQFLGAGAVRNPSSPWTILVSFPLGGVLFLSKRRKLKRDQMKTA